MRQLWVRLSLWFSIVIIGGVILIGSLTFPFNPDDRLLARFLAPYQVSGTLHQQLIAFYQQANGWDGIEALLEDEDARLPRVPGGGLGLLFADAAGRIIYDAYTGTVGTWLTPEQRARAVEISIQERAIGYILINQIALGEPPDDVRLYIQQQIATTVLTAMLGLGVISILAGIVVSRTLTSPLGKLAATARAFGAKNFDQRAETGGSREIVEVATAFNEMAAGLQRAEMLRRSQVADIAHELRTPLTVLKSNLQAMVDGVYTVNTEEVERLLEQTELLNRLVTDLHTLSQAEARQLQLAVDLLDLSVFVSKRVQNFNVIVETHALTLNTEIAEASIIVEADPARLEQVLNNLLHNAITHTPAGGTIRVAVSASADEAHLTVQDTGGGITSDHLPYIFERFYRADRSRSRSTGGTGLGLAIVRAIIELHGGSIQVTSTGVPGEGTVFTIRLPLADIEEAQPLKA